MIKTIFVPTSGNDTDARVFASVLALARPLGAHLRFFHLRLSACEAAVRSRHVEFCGGPAINDAFRHLEHRDADMCTAASDRAKSFCAANHIPIRSAPGESTGMSAQIIVEMDDAEARFLAHSRHSDLIVVGRPEHDDLLSYDLIERILLRSGRPVVIAPDSPVADRIDTVVIGWKDTAETARAVGAAMPLLKAANKVVIVHVAEPDRAVSNGADLLAEDLSWHGISAIVRLIRNPLAHVPGALQSMASEYDAGLLVVGGYGRGPWREAVFGGVTAALIDHAECPVLLMH